MLGLRARTRLSRSVYDLISPRGVGRRVESKANSSFWLVSIPDPGHSPKRFGQRPRLPLELPTVPYREDPECKRVDPSTW